MKHSSCEQLSSLIYSTVFSKRSGNPANLRLGQVQVTEKNDEVNPLSLSLEKERSLPRHGKALLHEHDLAQLEEGFDLVRSILVRARREDRRKVARLMSYIGGEKEEEQAGCGRFIDEIKLVRLLYIFYESRTLLEITVGKLEAYVSYFS